jgi:hypothetical protein
VVPAQPQRRTVQVHGGVLVGELGLHAVPAPVRRLGQPRFGRAGTLARSAETKAGTSGGPGQGHAAAVAARDLALGAEEPGIPAGVVRDVGDLGQAQ